MNSLIGWVTGAIVALVVGAAVVATVKYLKEEDFISWGKKNKGISGDDIKVISDKVKKGNYEAVEIGLFRKGKEVHSEVIEADTISPELYSKIKYRKILKLTI